MQGSKTGAARAIAAAFVAMFALAVFGAGPAGAATKKTTVKVATVPGVGAVLVNPAGKTLYTLTDANGAAIACTGPCLSLWPPAMVSANAKVTAPKGVKSLSATKDTHQVTWKALPLYTYAGDQTKNVANGEGLMGFGGTWHAVKVTKTASTTPTSAKSSSSYSGY
jgi:predicted lipoprotein with Yx(FWY)xxD motif